MYERAAKAGLASVGYDILDVDAVLQSGQELPLGFFQAGLGAFVATRKVRSSSFREV